MKPHVAVRAHVMCGCVLRVDGTDFDPLPFLNSVALEAYDVFRKGDPLHSGRRVHEAGGFQCNVSDDDGGSLAAQVRDAIGFLTKHRADLLRLKQEPQVESKWIDFGYMHRVGELTVQGEYLPVELLKLAAELEIAIGLSMYPPIGRA